MGVSREFSGVARFGSDGELVCFCYDSDVEAGRCACVGKETCCKANFTIDIVSTIEPVARKLDKDMDRAVQGVRSTSQKIKESLKDLEQAMRKNKFRI